MTQQRVHVWLERFELDTTLRDHVAEVVALLPGAVRGDLMDDPNFRICDYEPGAGKTMRVPMGVPRYVPPGAEHGGSRSVVLKRTLRRRSAAFVRYVIAHELAHAHLRNSGRDPEEDPEQAADALAAQWGFPCPEDRGLVVEDNRSR